MRLRPGRAPVLPAQDFVTCQLTGRSVSASGEGSACIVDAARSTLGCLCRYGLAGRLDAFFHALALHAVYQNRRIPKDESCLPYLTELFSFLPGSRWRLFWQSLKSFSASSPGHASFDKRILLGARRPEATAIMHAVEAEDAVGPSHQSVLNQTLENVEIICIDGASSDATFSVNLSRAKKGSRILSCRLASREPEAAERLGLDLARGKVCVFLGGRKAFRSRTILLELCAEGALRRERDRKLFFRG